MVSLTGHSFTCCLLWRGSLQRFVIRLLRLGCLIGLGPKVRSGGATLREVFREDRVNDGAENHLGATAKVQSKSSTFPTQDIYPVWGRAIHSTRTNLKV